MAKKRFDTTPEKRFKMLALLLMEINIAHDGKFSPLLDKLDELAEKIDENHPQALEALCYYEDNVLSILSEGMEVKELN